MSKRVCSTCKHYPRDEHCKECIYKFTIHGNAGWEPSEEFINKHCASEQACHEDKKKVLEKIKAEIYSARYIDKDTRFCENALASGLDKALEIIEKYMAESEKQYETSY